MRPEARPLLNAVDEGATLSPTSYYHHRPQFDREPDDSYRHLKPADEKLRHTFCPLSVDNSSQTSAGDHEYSIGVSDDRFIGSDPFSPNENGRRQKLNIKPEDYWDNITNTVHHQDESADYGRLFRYKTRRAPSRRRQKRGFGAVSYLARAVRANVAQLSGRIMWQRDYGYTALLSRPSNEAMSTASVGGSFKSVLRLWGGSEMAPKEAFYRPNGIHWITAALFIVADMAGGGVVAMPIAMLKSGAIFGCLVIAIVGAAFCYTANLLSKNWLLMCQRWPTVYGGSTTHLEDLANSDGGSNRDSHQPKGHDAFVHCRKPYPEMALRSIGGRAQTFTSVCLNVMLYGVSIVYLLLASKIISDFVASAFDIHIGQCSMLLIVSLALLPVTFLKSPQDFWWAVVTAMLTTAIAVALILVGTALDTPLCAPQAHHPEYFRPSEFLLSLGIFMFAFGGHGVFLTIQHDMKRPQQFTSSIVLAFAMVFGMYVPISLLGYAVYGDSLKESIIDSIQIPGIQVAANLCIAIHCILTLTIVINPLNQQFEHILHIPHHFGWRRILIRTCVMALIVFSAETVPSFGPILNLIGGSLVALTSAVLPCLFNLFMGARYENTDAVDYSNKLEKEPPVPTITEVIRRTSSSTLAINTFIIVLALVCGATTTWSALLNLASSTFSMPCYLSGSSLFGANRIQPMLCCGAERNVHRTLLITGVNASDVCTAYA